MLLITDYNKNNDLNELIKIMDDIKSKEYPEKIEILHEHKDFNTITYTNGKGSVFLYKNFFIVKIFSERALREGSIDNEFLLKLQGLDFPPILYCYDEDVAIMENVTETDVLEVLQDIFHNQGIEAMNITLESILDNFEIAMESMLKLGILYSDMKLDTHFKWDVKKNRFRIIDFGNCIFTKGDKTPKDIREIITGRRTFLKNRLLECIKK